MKGLTRIEWILGVMLLVLLAVVVVLGLLIWFQPTAPNTAVSGNSAAALAERADDIAPTPETPGQTARIAYAAARDTAVGWHADAVMLNASATWPQGSSELLMRNGQSTWGFTFYSPATGDTAVISVIEGTATLNASGTYQPAQEPVAATSWQIDSMDAIDIYMQAGGRTFLQQENITILTMYLNADNTYTNGRMEWLVSLLATESGRSLDMRIDATSGDILPNP